MFASGTILEHLARGAVGIGLLSLGLSLGAERPVIGTLLIVSALVPMRGCPICWTIGLLETVRQKILLARKSAALKNNIGGV